MEYSISMLILPKLMCSTTCYKYFKQNKWSKQQWWLNPFDHFELRKYQIFEIRLNCTRSSVQVVLAFQNTFACLTIWTILIIYWQKMWNICCISMNIDFFQVFPFYLDFLIFVWMFTSHKIVKQDKRKQ